MTTHTKNEPQAVSEYVRIAYTPADQIGNARRVQRAREVLHRQEVNNFVNYGTVRNTVRHEFSRPVLVILPVAEYPAFDRVVQIAFNCWSSNLSQSGLSIIVANTLAPVSLDDISVPELPTADCIKTASEIKVGIFNTADDAKWLGSHIVRMRSSSEDLLEIGIQFDHQIAKPPFEAKYFINNLRSFLCCVGKTEPL